jgi:hypothetical protein
MQKKKNPQQQSSSSVYQIISCSQTGGRIAKKLHTLKSKRRDHSRSDVEEEKLRTTTVTPVSKSAKLKTFHKCENLAAI